MRFVPVHLGFARLLSDLHMSTPFEFAPSTGAELALQSHDLADASADGDDFDLLDLADDLKVHCLSIRGEEVAGRKNDVWREALRL